MADIAATQQATKRVDKVVYSRNPQPCRAVQHDNVVTEQPLQIKLYWYPENEKAESKVFAITMRSLGNDKFLILGLLFSEGVIENITEVESIFPETSSENDDIQAKENNWQVHLIKGKQVKLTSIERFQTTYSSCGLCGSTSLKVLELKNPPNLLSLGKGIKFNADSIYTLADKMKHHQQLFTLTGGVHGAALFNAQAQLLTAFEDIGRHNAVDKLIGERLFSQQLPSSSQLLIMLVSGRVSYEIVQKAVMAGISILVAVGAPSALAIKAAQRFELTLIGFVSHDSFNLYHGDWRIT